MMRMQSRRHRQIWFMLQIWRQRQLDSAPSSTRCLRSVTLRTRTLEQEKELRTSAAKRHAEIVANLALRHATDVADAAGFHAAELTAAPDKHAAELESANHAYSALADEHTAALTELKLGHRKSEVASLTRQHDEALQVLRNDIDAREIRGERCFFVGS